MNAPNGTMTALEPVLEMLPLAAIAPSETRIQELRRRRYNLETLADLRMSIAKQGIQQPGVVRRLGAMRGLAQYELVCGERRWRAAQQAGLGHFPAIVRELTDAEVLEIQLVENVQRELLHPLEEAAGYQELMQASGLNAEEIGARVGRARSVVYSFLNLLRLEDPAKNALEDGRIDLSRAQFLASVAEPERRARALELALRRTYDGKPVYSVRELRGKLLEDKLTVRLAGAPFDRNAEDLLPGVGACGPCEHRSGNCDPDALDLEICTNAACFQEKVAAAGQRRREAIAASGGKVLKGEDARRLSPSVNTVGRRLGVLARRAFISPKRSSLRTCRYKNRRALNA